MKKEFRLITLIMCLLSAQFVFSQIEPASIPDSKKSEPSKNEITPELKKEAVEFLRNSMAEVNNMRTLESRISFSSEMASLMWFESETDARAMYQNVINDFRQLVGQYDAQLNSNAEPKDDAVGGFLFGASGSNVERKFTRALGVRQQIATGLAEHDPQLAFQFFTEITEAISNPKMRERTEQSDTYFMAQLLSQIADTDAELALKFARKNLQKSFGQHTINILKKIYDKDSEKGIAFGEDIVSKLKVDSIDRSELYTLSSLISLGEESKIAKKDVGSIKEKRPVFSDQQMRELAEIFAREILKAEDGAEFEGYLSQIEKYTPSRATQIRAKFGIKNSSMKGEPKIAPAKTELRDETPVPPSPKEKNENQLSENLANLAKKELPDEEKQKVIGQSRKIIDSIGNRNQKIMALSGLAMQVSMIGDKKLATEILDDARALTTFQPVNYRDYLESLILISGYAQTDPDKAFPIIESTIYRINDTITSFVKVAEFIDVGGEILEDGEVQLGGFGGTMTRELMGGLGAANTTVRSLAIADFKRTRDLTNRFDRQEVRVLAKMLVLRAILGDDKPQSSEIDGAGF